VVVSENRHIYSTLLLYEFCKYLDSFVIILLITVTFGECDREDG